MYLLKRPVHATQLNHHAIEGMKTTFQCIYLQVLGVEAPSCQYDGSSEMQFHCVVHGN